MRRWLPTAIKLGITAVALAILLVHIRPSALVSSMKAFTPVSIVAATLLIAAQAFVASIRWHLILRFLGKPIDLVRTLRIFWVGMFFAAVLPGAIAGDGMRIWMLSRDRVSLSSALSSVLLDRVVGLIGLLATLAVALPLASDALATPALRSGIAALIAFGVGIILLVLTYLRLPRWLARRPLLGRLELLLADARALTNSSSLEFQLILVSAAAILLNALALCLLMRDVSGAFFVADGVVLALIVFLSMSLPFFVGGWGIREGMSVALYGAIGIPTTGALAASLIMGVLSIIVSLPGGLIWMNLGSRLKAVHSTKS